MERQHLPHLLHHTVNFYGALIFRAVGIAVGLNKGACDRNRIC